MAHRPFWLFAILVLAGVHSPAFGQVAPHDPTSIIGSLEANGPAATFSEPGVGPSMGPAQVSMPDEGILQVGMSLTDNVDLQRAQVRQVFLGAFEVPFTEWTEISEFGPPMVNSHFLTQAWPVVSTLYMTTNANGDLGGAPNPTDGVRVRATDWARNTALSTDPIPAALLPVTGGVPSELQGIRVAHPPTGTVVCGGLSDACATGTPGSLTVRVEAIVDLGAPNPFERVYLFRRDVDGVDQRVGLETEANPRDEGGVTIWTTRITFDPSAMGGLPPQGTTAVWAVGVNEVGDGFLTNSSGSFITLTIE